MATAIPAKCVKGPAAATCAAVQGNASVRETTHTPDTRLTPYTGSRPTGNLYLATEVPTGTAEALQVRAHHRAAAKCVPYVMAANTARKHIVMPQDRLPVGCRHTTTAAARVAPIATPAPITTIIPATNVMAPATSNSLQPHA